MPPPSIHLRKWVFVIIIASVSKNYGIFITRSVKHHTNHSDYHENGQICQRSTTFASIAIYFVDLYFFCYFAQPVAALITKDARLCDYIHLARI